MSEANQTPIQGSLAMQTQQRAYGPQVAVSRRFYVAFSVWGAASDAFAPLAGTANAPQADNTNAALGRV